ncbi:uncharacterized protein F5147DRAFT_777959 [Suillus discolor]|uniref:Uncharacterized protein n=1 Tax=Suillus discolor TaxID=1912936 RepID=A0A9P7F006_9AGAM|nr:uncharacterized protein F5147DRAFT_777959 [Suillus discolor]KAG2097510.1 hypothetical protein F5147DRAFT_777959 [Suillus discolor]
MEDNNDSYSSSLPPSGRSTQSQAASPVPLINTNLNDPDAYVEKLQRNWAKGPHLEFLNSQLPLYSASPSLSEGSAKASEQLDSVINGYFQCFPWRLKVTDNPNMPYNPLIHPPIDLVCEIEIKQKQHKSIHAWLDYQTRKTQKFKRRAKPENDEWAWYLALQLSGLSKTKPKALQPHQRSGWSKDHFDDIVKKDFHKQWKKAGLPSKNLATFHDSIT